MGAAVKDSTRVSKTLAEARMEAEELTNRLSGAWDEATERMQRWEERSSTFRRDLRAMAGRSGAILQNLRDDARRAQRAKIASVIKSGSISEARSLIRGFLQECPSLAESGSRGQPDEGEQAYRARAIAGLERLSAKLNVKSPPSESGS